MLERPQEPTVDTSKAAPGRLEQQILLGLELLQQCYCCSLQYCWYLKSRYYDNECFYYKGRPIPHPLMPRLPANCQLLLQHKIHPSGLIMGGHVPLLLRMPYGRLCMEQMVRVGAAQMHA